MLIPPLLALSLICQRGPAVTAPAARTNPVVRAKVNDTVTISPSVVATDMESLDRFARLTSGPPGVPLLAEAQAGLKMLDDQGRLIELTDPTRAVIQGVFKGTPAAAPGAPAPTTVYRGRLLDGPSRTRMAFFFATQLMGVAESTPAAPSEFTAGKQAEIYRAVKGARNAAQSRASDVNLSIRKVVIERETIKGLEGVRLRYDLTSSQLDGIISQGELLDGTTARRALASDPARLATRARNQTAGALIDQEIGREVNQAMIQAANTPPPSLGRANNAPFTTGGGAPFFGMGNSAPAPPPYYAGGRTVYVNGYWRSNGTYVAPYYRSPPSY